MKLPNWLTAAKQLAAQHRATSGRPAFHAEAMGGRGILYLYDVIGEDWWTGGGIKSKHVAEALDAYKSNGVKALDIFINSPGGDIFEAKAIHTLFRRFEGERVVYVDGIAASAASFIAMAGDRIVTAPSATWMIHNVWAVAVGGAEDMLSMASVLEMEDRTFAETYAARTKAKLEDVAAWMKAETWMNAAQAKERGFTDEIADGSVYEARAASTSESAELLRELSAASRTLFLTR